MSPRRPSRWLAPLALLAALLAVFLVINSSTGGDDGDGDENGATTAQEDRRESRSGRRGTTDGERTGTQPRTTTGPRRETYTIRPGDTLNVIAERTGVPVDEIERLNPDVDPNNLPVGERIRLTE